MSRLLEQLMHLSTAEEFFLLLGVPYDEGVMNVSRLHVLKRFQQYLARADLHLLDEAAQADLLRELLARAHADFVRSSPVAERLFKVFQEADGRHAVGLERLRAALPSRRVADPA